FSFTRAATVVLCAAAIPERVSPFFTVYVPVDVPPPEPELPPLDGLPGTMLVSMPPGSQWSLPGTWECPKWPPFDCQVDRLRPAFAAAAADTGGFPAGQVSGIPWARPAARSFRKF